MKILLVLLTTLAWSQSYAQNCPIVGIPLGQVADRFEDLLLAESGNCQSIGAMVSKASGLASSINKSLLKVGSDMLTTESVGPIMEQIDESSQAIYVALEQINSGSCQQVNITHLQALATLVQKTTELRGRVSGPLGLAVDLNLDKSIENVKTLSSLLKLNTRNIPVQSAIELVCAHENLSFPIHAYLDVEGQATVYESKGKYVEKRINELKEDSPIAAKAYDVSIKAYEASEILKMANQQVEENQQEAPLVRCVNTGAAVYSEEFQNSGLLQNYPGVQLMYLLLTGQSGGNSQPRLVNANACLDFNTTEEIIESNRYGYNSLLIFLGFAKTEVEKSIQDVISEGENAKVLLSQKTHWVLKDNSTLEEMQVSVNPATEMIELLQTGLWLQQQQNTFSAIDRMEFASRLAKTAEYHSDVQEDIERTWTKFIAKRLKKLAKKKYRGITREIKSDRRKLRRIKKVFRRKSIPDILELTQTTNDLSLARQVYSRIKEHPALIMDLQLNALAAKQICERPSIGMQRRIQRICRLLGKAANPRKTSRRAKLVTPERLEIYRKFIDWFKARSQ